MQTIKEPARGKNTLDLVFASDPESFTQIDETRTGMSDHNIIEISTDIKDNNNLMKHSKDNSQIEETDLRQLNFHHEKVDWAEIKEVILNMPWKKCLTERIMRNVQRSL